MRIKYIGESRNDLTTDTYYDAEEANHAYLTILADDAGDEHTVPKSRCVVMPDHDPRWADDDDSIADVPAPCGNITASEAVARTAPCTASDIPEGPESTADLRKYRYTPDTY